MKSITIRRIGIWSLAVFQLVIGLIVGAICGMLYAFGGMLIDVLVSLDLLDPVAMSTPGLSYGTVLAFGALIGMPAIFGSIGFALGLAEALLFNLAAMLFKLKVGLSYE